MFGCGPDFNLRTELYSIATRQSQIITFGPSLGGSACSDAPGCVYITGIGTDWIGLQSAGDMEHCRPTFAFENLRSGALVVDPTNRVTTVDLTARRR